MWSSAHVNAAALPLQLLLAMTTSARQVLTVDIEECRSGHAELCGTSDLWVHAAMLVNTERCCFQSEGITVVMLLRRAGARSDCGRLEGSLPGCSGRCSTQSQCGCQWLARPQGACRTAALFGKAGICKPVV